MASTVLFALFASLFLRAVLTLPVAQDLKSVNNSKAILKRLERDVVRGYYSCGQGMVWLLDQLICVPIEKYNEASADDYEEMNRLQNEDNTQTIKTTTQATMMPHLRTTTQATMMPQPVPKSPPDGTPHSPTRSTPKPTLPIDSTTPSLLPLQVTNAAQPSPSPTTKTAILLMLFIALFYRTV